jgi:hypothetical protein
MLMCRGVCNDQGYAAFVGVVEYALDDKQVPFVCVSVFIYTDVCVCMYVCMCVCMYVL